ncbi:MAG: BamA/TamA family outer membrane protein [Haliscomenobacter sp.]|nr:BamA/TamA family outer membrane protein [Haliscomenobacter sp.]
MLAFLRPGGKAQERLVLYSDGPLPARVRVDSLFSDSVTLFRGLGALLNGLQDKGYLESSLDSLSRSDSLWSAWLHVGSAYSWGSLDLSARPPGAAVRPGQQKGQPVSKAALSRFQDRLLQDVASEGYPFARIRTDSIQTAENRLSLRLVLNEGTFYALDTLIVEGDAPVSNRFLQQYLGLIPGKPYSQSAVLRIRERIRALPYLQLVKDPEVRFSLGRAEVILPLSARNASRFDFLIGVLPNNLQTGRLLLTGSLEGEFLNQLGGGERIYARIEQLRPQTQRLDIQMGYPYLVGLPLGLDARLHLYKRDTSFLDADASLGVRYLFQGASYFKAFWNQRSSRLLGFNADAVVSANRLPANLDVRVASFGFETGAERLDYRFNPRRGWVLQSSIGAGTKRIIPNKRIEDLGLGNLYDSLALHSTQVQIAAKAGAYFPLFKRSVFYWGLQGKGLLSRQPALPNEQFRLGGNRLLRGFDEEFFQITNYVVNTWEYRLLLSENAYLSVFADAGWLEDRTAERANVLFPVGWGGGITFETRAGVFGLNLAYGVRWGEKPDWTSPKVHLGYVSLF